MRPGLSIALVVALSLPFVAAAQALGTVPVGVPFNVSVDPQYPAPFGQAVLSALSDSIDLAGASMTITVAGKKIYEGNVKPVAVALGKAGSVTSAIVKISSGGASASQTIAIQPQDVVLVAEPVSSAPPLYPGKPLIPLEGSVRMVAVANLRGVSGKALDPATYSYAWTVDNTSIAASSGIGKSALMVASPLQYRQRDVSVAVRSADGALVGGDSFSLVPQEPSVRIYQNDPLLGIRYDRAFADTYSISGSEDTLYATPFSFPITTGVPLLQWFLNGEPAQTGNLITLRPSGSGEGTASLSLTASAGNSTIATTDLSLLFGGPGSTNIFGL